MKLQLILYELLLVLCVKCNTEKRLNILGVFPYPGKSHFAMTGALMKGLANRGHQVDVVSHFPLQKPIENYQDFSLKGSRFFFTNNVTYQNTIEFDSLDLRSISNLLGDEVCQLLSHPIFQRILKAEKGFYDVIIVEINFAHCYFALGRYLDAPVVGVVTGKTDEWLYDPLGIPFNPSYIPSLHSNLLLPMSFIERLKNTVLFFTINTQMNYYLESQRKYVQQFFDRNVSSMKELFDDMSLVLINSHHSLGLVPSTPRIVEVGGLHLYGNEDQLSPDIEEWLNESDEACIYFSFGSMIRIETFPEKTLQVLYETFSKINPIRVLIKITDPSLLTKEFSSNVKISPWISQTAVLKHKNVKLFVTHGGTLGSLEAVASGIPMLGIPIFGDQFTNLHMYERLKSAIIVKHEDISSESLTSAIRTILHDPTYRENMKKLSQLFYDRPMSAMDTAVFWVEYVARNGHVFDSVAVHLPLWQLYCLDIYGFITFVMILVIYLLKLAINSMLSFSNKKQQNRLSLDNKKKTK